MPLFFCLVRVLLGKVTNFLPFSLFGLVAHRGSLIHRREAEEQKSKGGGEEESDTGDGLACSGSGVRE